MLKLIDSQNGDHNLTSQVTVFTYTPSVSNVTLCQAHLVVGDEVGKTLDGSGGDFEVTITIGGAVLATDPEYFQLNNSETKVCYTTFDFIVPANKEVIIKLLSPNVADVSVDVTVYLCEVSAVDIAAVGGSTQSLTDFKDLVDTGYDPTTHLVQADSSRISGSSIAADKLEIVFDTDFTVNYSETYQTWNVNIERINTIDVESDNALVNVNVIKVLDTALSGQLASASALSVVNSTVNTISSNVTTIDGVVDAIKLSTDSLSSNVSSIGKFDGLPTLITKLSHHYKLNELSGTTVVDSVGDLDGVASTNITALTKPGKINTCFYNDTGSRYVDLQDDLSEIFSKSFSINLWVKAVSATNSGYFFGASKAGDGEKLTMAINSIGVENNVRIFYNDYEGAGLLEAAGVDCTDWTMLTLVMTATGVSSATLSLYVNGVFVIDNNIYVAYSSWDCSNIYLLNANASEVPASTFVGYLDSVMIFNNVLTQEEITYLYNGGFGVEDLTDISSVKAKTDLLTNIDTSIEFINTQLASMVDYDTTDGYRFTSESLAQGPTESSDLVTLTTTINQIKRLIDSN